MSNSILERFPNLSSIVFPTPFKNVDSTKPHVYMGIGVWSAAKKLSEDLPIDVIKMLIAARASLEVSIDSKLFILLADSFALQEGADKELLQKITKVYQEKISQLLKQLHLDKQAKIVFASDVEQDPTYISLKEKFSKHSLVGSLEDRNINYVVSQSAMTAFMHDALDVGVKIGWMKQQAFIAMSKEAPFVSESWDEARFDDLFRKISGNSQMQFIYAKAGAKITVHSKQCNVEEACPYVGFSSEKRLFVHSGLPLRKITRKEAKDWEGVAELCQELAKLQLIDKQFIKEDILQKPSPQQIQARSLRTNLRGVVYDMMAQWTA